MSITVEKVKEVKKSTVPVTKPAVSNNEQLFQYSLNAPSDSLLTKKLWSDDVKAVLMHATEQMGISSYKPSILKDDNTAIAKAQSHLIDLLKYYEGDRNYYYEATTSPYKDKFSNYTCGFGELTNKPLTQEKAYQHLCEKLEKFSGEVKNLLNKKIGKNTYETLPNSIKEGLIDLCYNKGLGKISQNSELMSAIKAKDYSKIIKNLKYVYSGKSDAEKVEDAGLYRRSLNRLILASRDLKGKEKEQASAEIDSLYKDAKNCHKKNNVSTIELDKIYEQFKTGKISNAPVSAESYKFTVDETFKGKGTWGVAQALYKSLGTDEVSFEEFYKEFKSINNDIEEVKIGQEVKVPYLNNIKNPAPVQKEIEVTNKTSDKNDKKPEVEEKAEEKGGFWNGVKNFFKKVGKGISDGLKMISRSLSLLFLVPSMIFGRKKNDDDVPASESSEKTVFQKMLKNSTIRQDGEFQVVTMDYEIKKGDNLWNIAREYATTEEILCNDNDIKDKNKLSLGQKIKIQKLGYKIEKGDNLFRIAQKFGLTSQILKDLNNVEDIDKIQAGDMLEIPGFIYKVKQGDSLSTISQKVGVPEEKLMKLNGLETDKILPNQEIKVVYNNSDFAVSSDDRKVVVDKKTNTLIETINMSKTANLKNRPLLQQKRKVNGFVEATRKVFEPKPGGPLSGMTIIVNAGHGYSQAGTDKGTLGIGKTEDEWLINYDNAMRLKDRLCAKGARVIFLQGHVNIIEKELGKKSNKADLMISVHVNSCTKKVQDRTQIYTYNRASAVNQKSKKLSAIMEKNFDNWIQKHEKTAPKDLFINPETKKPDYAQSKEANYSVVRNSENIQKIPAVLWEVAFMVSPKGRERLNNPALLNNYSDIMVQSVEQYFRAERNC